MPKVSSSSVNSSSAKMTDIALRKKKNADAQAAFRARRNNYISTLEATVTNLESVVLQLQDSCRETRNEAQELRQDNGRLRLQLKEREHFWRTVWSRKNQGDGEEFPALPPAGPFNGSLTVGSQVHQYGDVPAYRENSAISCTQTQSPTGAYSTVDTDAPDPYFSNVSHHHPSWPPRSSSGGESVVHQSTTHSPTLHSESTPFVFSSSSRSLSPSVPTPTTPLAPFQFGVSDAVHERSHPGSLSGAQPDGRYRPSRRDGTLLPTVLTPISGGSDNGSQHGSDGDSGAAPQISGTLAVIKAQSFGALRRTRTRNKRPVESAAKVAMDVLQSRGLQMGVQVSVKRQRRCEDEGDGDGAS